jgi:cytochrome b involved in lipid metabolism
MNLLLCIHKHHNIIILVLSSISLIKYTKGNNSTRQSNREAATTASQMFRQATTKYTPLVSRVATRSLATRAQNSVAAAAASKKTNGDNNESRAFYIRAAAALAMSMATAGTVTMMEARKGKMPPSATMTDENPPHKVREIPRVNQPPPRPDLPIFTAEDVSEHYDESSLWYTFRGGVYDLTAFYEGHPGGSPVSIVSFSSKLYVASLLMVGLYSLCCCLHSVITAPSHGSRSRFGAILGNLPTASPRTCSRLDGDIPNRKSLPRRSQGG